MQATYRTLINIRVLLTGLFMQYFFQKQLTPKQWTGLCLLLLGCVIEQMGSFHLSDGLSSLVLVGLQASCASLGGIYFQWLLQREDAKSVDFWEKNLFLYAWGCLFNCMFITAMQPQLLSPSEFFRGYSWGTLPIIGLGVLGGMSGLLARVVAAVSDGMDDVPSRCVACAWSLCDACLSVMRVQDFQPRCCYKTWTSYLKNMPISLK